MTEYWVSQGNKWCDFCKIFISNNPTSIRNHEMGQRHKDNVSKRIDNMRQEKAAKAKEEEAAVRALQQIEAKAERSYQKDIKTFQEARKSNLQASTISEEWEYDSSSGYYYNQTNSCYYDPNSGFYYSDALGRWGTQEEALSATQISSDSTQKKPIIKKPSASLQEVPASENKSSATSQSGPPPGRVISNSLNPTRTVKGAPSSLSANKRKRPGEKPKVLSKEEKAAIKAREAARKRVEEREKPLLGLYKH